MSRVFGAVLVRAFLICVLAFGGARATVAQAQPPAGPVVLQQVGASGGGAWVQTVPDSFFASGSAITSATTTLLISGDSTPSQRAIYVFFAAVQSTGTNSAATFNFEWGTGATCGTGTVTMLPTAVSAGAFAAGQLATEWSSANINAAAGGVSPASVPFVVPPGNNLCLVSAGTTIAYKAVVYYAFR